MSQTKLGAIFEDPTKIDELPETEIPALLTQIAAVQTGLAARMLKSQAQNNSASDQSIDLIDIHEAARMLNCSVSRLYRRASKVPYAARDGRKWNFSKKGIQDDIRKRMGSGI